VATCYHYSVSLLLIGEARGGQVEVMVREGCFTHGLCHSNISSLLAVCFHPTEPPLLIYAHLDEGVLKTFLRRCKISDVGLNQVRLDWTAVIHFTAGVGKLLLQRATLKILLLSEGRIYILSALITIFNVRNMN